MLRTVACFCYANTFELAGEYEFAMRAMWCVCLLQAAKANRHVAPARARETDHDVGVAKLLLAMSILISSWNAHVFRVSYPKQRPPSVSAQTYLK
jgi:hypothetical protein